MWSLVLYVVAAGSTLHMNAMDGMDGQTDDRAQLNSRQLSRDDQGVAQDHLKYTGCDSNFRGGRQYSCPDASFPICGDLHGKGMYEVFKRASGCAAGQEGCPLGKCRAGAQFTPGLMNVSHDLTALADECGTILKICHGECNANEAGVCSGAITAMDSECMAKERHLGAIGDQISRMSLELSGIAKNIRKAMVDGNHVQNATSWQFVVSNASTIAGILGEIVQQGELLENRGDSLRSSIYPLEAFCAKVYEITNLQPPGKALFYRMINALEMTVKEIKCVGGAGDDTHKCVDGEWKVSQS